MSIRDSKQYYFIELTLHLKVVQKIEGSFSFSPGDNNIQDVLSSSIHTKINGMYIEVIGNIWIWRALEMSKYVKIVQRLNQSHQLRRKQLK